jgi:hypothetical protein
MIPQEPCVIERGLPGAVLEPFDAPREHDLLGEGRAACEQVRSRLRVVEVAAEQHRHDAAAAMRAWPELRWLMARLL